MITARNFRAALILLLPSLWLSNALGQEPALVAELHANPPPPCIAKPKFHGMVASPTGATLQEYRGIMGYMASMLLSAGASHMTADNIDVVYTAAFFENEPANEIGIYAYKLSRPVDPDTFSPGPYLNGKLFVIDRDLLVILWYKNKDKTAGCFSAMNKLLTDRL